VEYAWRLISPLLEAWQAGPPPAFPNYEAGTWGPTEADELFDQPFRAATEIRAATVRERTGTQAKWRRL
jgi:glucose-6-phosphate 1-dehydrogenase